MKAMEIHDYGPAEEVMKLNPNAPEPHVWRNHVLIRVKACSVNPIDCRMRAGYGRSVLPLWRGVEFPLILGRDCAGIVEKVGFRVRKFKAGDEVFTAPDLFGQGTYAEYVSVNEKHVVQKPANLGFTEAASIPFVALTAWEGLVNRAGLTPENAKGKRVLVHGGSGGIGTFAIQLLKFWGCYVATTCSRRNLPLVRKLGADEAIDYRTEDFSQHLKNMDVVLDTIAGEVESKSLRVLKRFGNAHYVSLVPPLLRYLDSHGPIVGGSLYAASGLTNKLINMLWDRSYDWAFFKPDGEALERIRSYLEAGRIRPVVDRVFPLEQAAKAHKYCETGHPQGKVVLAVD